VAQAVDVLLQLALGVRVQLALLAVEGLVLFSLWRLVDFGDV